MLEDTRDYIKCSIRNRMTLGGYFLIGCGIVGEIFDNKLGVNINSLIPIFYGYVFIAGTKHGNETYKIYKKTKTHIKRSGTLSSFYISKFEMSLYCDKTGLRLAAEEFNLEYLLKEKRFPLM